MDKLEDIEMKKNSNIGLYLVLAASLLLGGGAVWMLIKSSHKPTAPKQVQPEAMSKVETQNDNPIDLKAIEMAKKNKDKVQKNSVQVEKPHNENVRNAQIAQSNISQPEAKKKKVHPQAQDMDHIDEVAKEIIREEKSKTTHNDVDLEIKKVSKPATIEDLRSWALAIKDDITIDPYTRTFTYKGKRYAIGDTIEGVGIEDITPNYIRFATLTFHYNLRFKERR